MIIKSEVRSQKSEVRSQKSEVRSQSRILSLDLVKGINIFLVVFGHCMQYGNGKEFDFLGDNLFKIIYSFHMPLFALVSGYLFFLSAQKRNARQLFFRQVNNLILPLFSWVIFINLCRIYSGNFESLSAWILSVINGLVHTLWFLRAMFMAVVIVIIIREKFNDETKIYVLAVILLMFTPGRIIPATHSYVFPYFVIGYLWHREGNSEKITDNLLIQALIIFLWLFMLLFFNEKTYIYTTGLSVIKRTGFVPKQIFIDLFRWAIGLFGSLSVIIILSYIKPLRIITAIGEKSLGIYIISSYITSYVLNYFGDDGGYIINFIESLIIMTICYLLSLMISRIKILNKIFFGGR